jgi:TonB family protein
MEGVLVEVGDSFMPFVRLKTFLIISSVLHIVALFIVAAFFHPQETFTKPQLIGVGLVNGYIDPGMGNGSPSEPSLMGAQNPGKLINKWVDLERPVEPSPKGAPKPEKKIVKNVVKEHQLKEIPKREEAINRADELTDEKGIYQPSQSSRGGERTDEIASNTADGSGSSTSMGSSQGIGAGGSGFGAKGSGQGGEQAGYPDYKINPKPRYPMIARRSGYQGVVLLRVWVMENGKVGKIELERSSGYEMLDQSAIDAVKGWVFIPGKKNGVPISSWVMVPIKFQLSKG